MSDSKCEYIDEHFIPTGSLDLDSYLARADTRAVHHLIRYLWAIECIADRSGISSILDLGCGAGYGSFLLAERYPHVHVTGADYDPRAVETAKENYVRPNLEYRIGDGTRWSETVGDGLYDCITAFDVLEHVNHRELFMESLLDHVSDSGCLLFSTPCAWMTNQVEPPIKVHKLEYSAASLFDFLRRYFETIRRPDDESLPHVEVFDRLKGTNVDYFLFMNPVMCESPIRVANPYRTALTTCGAAKHHAISGDWGGTGADAPGLFDSLTGTVTLLGASESDEPYRIFNFGVEGAEWLPITGDWDGNGVDTVGVFNAETGIVLLKNTNGPGEPDARFDFGVQGVEWVPVAGDWDGDGVDTVGVFSTATKTWHLKNSNAQGPFDVSCVYGPDEADVYPVAGDWQGSGRDSIGVFSGRASSFFLKSTPSNGRADFSFTFGTSGNIPLVGDWDGDGIDTVGVYNAGRFFLKNSHAPGDADAMRTVVVTAI